MQSSASLASLPLTRSYLLGLSFAQRVLQIVCLSRARPTRASCLTSVTQCKDQGRAHGDYTISSHARLRSQHGGVFHTHSPASHDRCTRQPHIRRGDAYRTHGGNNTTCTCTSLTMFDACIIQHAHICSASNQCLILRVRHHTRRLMHATALQIVHEDGSAFNNYYPGCFNEFSIIYFCTRVW